jgi:hypothetical protein
LPWPIVIRIIIVWIIWPVRVIPLRLYRAKKEKDSKKEDNGTHICSCDVRIGIMISFPRSNKD